MTTMKKKTVILPGIGPTLLYYGPGFIAISDIDGTARVEAQGYTAEELQAATTEQRAPVSVHRQSTPLAGAAYLAFKAAHPDFTAAVITAAWEVLETPLDTDSGQKDADGNPVMVNFWADAEDAELG